MATATRHLLSRNVREQTFRLGITDTTAVKVATLPVDARLIAILVNVTTAFSGGTDTFSMGTTAAAPTDIVNTESLAAAGNIALGTDLASPGHETTTPIDIYAVVGAGNTAGAARITILYSQAADKAY